MTPVAVMVGANRIVPAAGIIHPLGNVDLSAEDEKALRRRIVERALQALQTEVVRPTVFTGGDWSPRPAHERNPSAWTCSPTISAPGAITPRCGFSAVEEEYGDRIASTGAPSRSSPTRSPGAAPPTRPRRAAAASRAEEPRAHFAPPAVGTALPASSMPALIAAKCAERQSVARSAACTTASSSPTSATTSISRSRTCSGAWPGRAASTWRASSRTTPAGDAYQATLSDYAEGTAWFGVPAVPAVIFNEKVSLVGAVPVDRYRAILDWFLAGEPGGLVPIPPDDAAAGATQPAAT